MYTKEEQAIRFVVKAFENQTRQKENINLSFHSISVGFMLKNIGCEEVVVISGLLHDVIEDTVYTYNDIKEYFGKDIANNVLAVSENKEITDWKKRKVDFIKKLKKQSKDVILIELADKLHNLISDFELWEEKGSLALATSHASFEDNKWYYLEMQKVFQNALSDNKLLRRYNKICEMYFK